ncbi:hypothetical protein VULLAG_LOCUS12540 [Vulpes lagopus]
MPGPRSLANLVELFWEDGFGRIHEIQVSGAAGDPGGGPAGGPCTPQAAPGSPRAAPRPAGGGGSPGLPGRRVYAAEALGRRVRVPWAPLPPELRRFGGHR